MSEETTSNISKVPTDDYQAELEQFQEQLGRLSQLASLSLAPKADDRVHANQEAAQQLARLQSAQAALKLAATLLEMNNNPTARELKLKVKEFEEQISAWRNTVGWFEDRWITRLRGTFGPYRYFRWRDAAGKLQTEYLGKVQQQVAHSTYEPPTPQAEQAEKAKKAGGLYWLANSYYLNHDLIPFARLDYAEYVAANFRHKTRIFRAETHAEAYRQYQKFLAECAAGIASW